MSGRRHPPRVIAYGAIVADSLLPSFPRKRESIPPPAFAAAMDSRFPGCVKTPSRPHVLDECCQNREIWIRKIRAVLLPDSNVPNVVPIREFSHSLFRGNDDRKKHHMR